MKLHRKLLRNMLLVGAMIVTSVSDVSAEQKHSGFLTNYEMLRPGPEGGAKEVWTNPKFKFPNHVGSYHSLLIEPVVIYIAKTSSNRGLSVRDLRQLASDLETRLIAAVGGRYKLASSPAEGVLVLRVALTDVELPNPALDTVTSVVPVARVVSFLKKKVTGRHSFVGSASIEGVLVDGGTNETLIAFVDTRSGDKGVGGSTDKFEDAREAFKWWGDRLRTFLEQARSN